MKKNKILSIVIVVLTFFCLSGCVSTAKTSVVENKEGVEYRLQNNIPVYVKKNTANHIYSLYIVVSGGSDVLPPEKSGLEAALFYMMQHGSEKYPYSTLQNIEYKTDMSLSGMSLNEGSILGLNCIDSYFNSLLPILIDGFLQPDYEQDQYEALMTEYNQSIQTMMNDPSSLLVYEASRTIYKGHPYETSSNVTPDSLKNITIANMKDLHGKILDAGRISVIAVGNIDGKKLVSELNGTLGKLPILKNDFSRPVIPPATVDGSPKVFTLKSAEGTGYIARVFALPTPGTPDYVSSYIASDIYSEIMFNIIREKHGACYTPQSIVSGAMAPCGIEFIFKASDLAGITKYMTEARDLMEQGKLIAGKNDDGTYKYTDIQSKLDGYKNSYINRIYTSLQTNSGVASRFAISLLRFGDPYESDKLDAAVQNVTAQDILRVFDTYWIKGTSQWFAVVGPGDENKIDFTAAIE